MDHSKPWQVHGEFAKKLGEEQEKNAASQKTARNSMRKKERRQKGLAQVNKATLLIRTRTLPGPYRRPMPRVLGGS